MRALTRTSILIASLGLAAATHADHFSGATISYVCLGSNQYRVSLDLYLDCGGVPITPHTLTFSNNCGVTFSLSNLNPVSVTEVSPLCPSQLANSTCTGGTQPSFKKYRFQVTLFLSPCNKWTMSWYTCCRNTTQNVQNAPGLYAEATLNNAGGFCDNSPVFNDVGIPYVCVNQPASYSLGAVDPDGHAMSFSLIAARLATPVPTSVTYQTGFSATQPIPGITIDPITGQLNFLPTAIGYYVVAVEARSFNESGALIGTVMRDLMFAVIACDGTAPQTAGLSAGTNGVAYTASSFVACSGNNFCLSLTFTDPNPAQSIAITSNAAAMLPGSTLALSGTNPVTATLCWTATAASYPLGVTFQATDNACPIANASSFAVTAMDCAYLPVELLGFEAEPAAEGVVVRWRTGSESGTRAYVVERARDGASFTTVGELPADEEVQAYGFVDRWPLDGLSYYRLRMLDADGHEELGPVVPVWLADAERVIATMDADGRWNVQGCAPNAAWSVLRADGAALAMGQVDETGSFTLNTNDANAPLLVVVREATGQAWLKLPPSRATESGTRVRASR